MTDEGRGGSDAPAGPAGAVVPASTYRLQLRRGFGFREATEACGHLDRLGITDVYLSPCFTSAPGSEHGYDVTDPNLLSDALGGVEAQRGFAAALVARGMGQIIDVVPNHMGVGHPRANAWWWDVLENGECSPYARFFDIEWRPVKAELRDRVLLPVLGDQYGNVLERGELSLARDGGALVLRYFDLEFPVNPRRIPDVLRPGLEELAGGRAADDPDLREFLSVLTSLEHLPARLETDPQRIAERQREKEVARERMARLLERSEVLRVYVEDRVRRTNGVPGEPGTFDALHALLESQAYRLAYWRTAFHEINYRRFFDVNALASIRVEDPRVFTASHRLVWELLRSGPRTGLRIDHLDGLFDPGAYLGQLAASARRALGPGAPAADPPVYLVAEKVFSPDEDLPDGWPLHGTTGYDFMNDLNGLFVDPGGLRELHRFYRRFTRREGSFEEVVYRSKKVVLESTLAAELNMLAHELNLISEGDRRSRDHTLNSLRDMLAEVITCFPVYRTYIDHDGPRATDREIIAQAVRQAQRRNPAMAGSIFEFLVDVLLDAAPPDLAVEEREARRQFTMRFQQYTGPVKAKGVEDTAFYRHVVLVSVNEVGGSPDRPALTPERFHDLNRIRRARWPHGMLATSTHDTKRGEDVRARLNVISELAGEWTTEVAAWSRINAVNRTRVDGEWAPDRGDEYLFYQTLAGIWPHGDVDIHPLIGRLRTYMRKAVREAKLHTSWINEHRDYERALDDFVERSLGGGTAERFLARFLPFQRRLSRAGAVNSLAQLALKLVSPGVPDFYQGTEFWSLTLVDPDNRRPVDFAAAAARVDAVEPVLDPRRPEAERRAALAARLAGWEDGGIKLLLTVAGTRLRRTDRALFEEGDYLPLAIEGPQADRAVALARRLGHDAVVVVVPRLAAGLVAEGFPLGEAVWHDTQVLLPDDVTDLVFHDRLSGAVHRPALRDGVARLPIAPLLRTFPVALLRSGPDHEPRPGR